MVVEKKKRYRVSWKWAGVALAILSIFAIRYFLPLKEWVQAFNLQVGELGDWGMLLYAGFYALATVLMVPGAVLTLGAGFLFGVAKGVVVVSVGATIGAALAFLIGRYAARDWVVSRAEQHAKFRVVDRAIGKEGWKIVGLLRLSPAIPFALSNYLYGLTAVGFWPYVLMTWLGILPGTLMYVYLGAAGKAGLQVVGDKQAASTLEWMFFSVGLLATVAVTLLVTRIAQKALRRAGKDEN